MAIIIKEINKDDYQKFWNENNLHILQSIEWGKVKESEGWEYKTIGIYEGANESGNEIELGELKNILGLQIKSRNSIKYGYVPKTLLNNYFEKLAKYFKEELRLDLVIFEFDYSIGTQFNQSRILIDYNDHIQPEQTNIVKLNKTEDELFALLKGNYRRNIKKGINDGLKTKVYTNGNATDNGTKNEAIDKFYNVLTEVFANTKYLSRPKTYFSTVWDILSNSNKAIIITAEIGQEVLGSYFVVYDNQNAYELYGGVTKKGRDYEAGYVLKWEAIKYFNSLGKITYDHWGVSKRNIDGTYQKDELHNISSFKEGFGGEYHEFLPAKVMVLDSTKYKLFSLLKRSGKFFTKIKKALR